MFEIQPLTITYLIQIVKRLISKYFFWPFIKVIQLQSSFTVTEMQRESL